jgi:two-component system sensor histidine kinase VicK
MFLKSLQWRLVSFFCLITFCLICPIWLSLSDSVEKQYYSMFTQKIEDVFKNLNIKTPNPDENELKNELRNNSVIFLFNIDTNRSYTITDRYGRLVDTNDTDFLDNWDDAANALLKSANFVQALAGGKNNRRILESYGGRQFYDYAKPIGGYILYFRYYKDDWAGILNDFRRIILSSLAIAIAVSFAVGFLLTRTITAPIGRLMNKARSIASGDFDQVLEVKSNDEISKLTESFNFMATSLKNTLTEISSEKNKMETIFNYMTDGVIAFNLKGEVIHTNPASGKLLGEETPLKTYDEYCKKYGFSYSIEDVIYLQSQKTREISVNIEERIIKIYFAVFTDEARKPEGVIAVLQDVTEQQRLENMRKEFVANVSHELRTPLTSIKSYAETLLDGALEDREASERFLNVINSEADRMTRLVKDLLQLSRIENQQMQWFFEAISFTDLVKGAVEKMELEAAGKNQTLECYVLGDIPDIEADYGRVEQVVFNILINAIKYTPEGGAITVYVGRMYNEVYMKVADNGIGIPEADLPRIFERFYRVDKARSREMGGTGLGLSIAKEIVEAHSGTISINSEKGAGTEVTVRLPITQAKAKQAQLEALDFM